VDVTKHNHELFSELPEWVPVEAFTEYVAMRKKIRKPLTDYAVQLAVKTLWKLKQEGNDPTAVLEQSIFHSWQGLFAVKPEVGKSTIFKGVK
jgi:hypothetical protein